MHERVNKSALRTVANVVKSAREERKAKREPVKRKQGKKLNACIV